MLDCQCSGILHKMLLLRCALLCVLPLCLSVPADPGGNLPLQSPAPVSEWYFQIALEKSWIGWHTYYCKVAVKASKVDASKTARIIDCSETSVPYSSPFTLLTQDGDQGKPAVTGQPLYLLSFTQGLCSTSPVRQALSSSTHQLGQMSLPARSSQLVTRKKDTDAAGVSCSTEFKAANAFSLVSPGAEPGQPLPFSAPVNLREGDKYCTVASTEYSERALVCNLESAKGAVRLLFYPSVYPYAGLSSLFTRASCRVKSLFEPSTHDVLCAQEHLAAPLAAQFGHISVSARSTEGEVERESRLTLVTQTPGQPLLSGSIVGIQIFYPGLAGRLLQTCCATKEPPHIIYCEEATDPIAAECWFQLQVQQVDSGSAANGQTPLADGSLVSLSAYAIGRFCSTAYDATLLCASASFSTASRNLFTLHLGQA